MVDETLTAKVSIYPVVAGRPTLFDSMTTTGTATIVDCIALVEVRATVFAFNKRTVVI